MKPLTQTLLIFLGCAIAFALYLHLGKSQLDRKQDELQSAYDQLNARLLAIQVKKQEIPKLVAQLPYWRSQFDMFSLAMPTQVGDERFLASLTSECAANQVEILGVELTPGGPWLGKLSEEQRKKLEGIGVDVEAAQAVKTANYTMRLNGDYAAILKVLEALKRHGRMYTVDEFAGPAAGGAGTIVETIDQRNTPIMVSGRLYYGLPEGKVTAEQVREAVRKIVLTPMAGKVMHGIVRRAESIANPDQNTAREEESEGESRSISVSQRRKDLKSGGMLASR